MSARGPGAFFVNVDAGGMLVLRGELDIRTIQDLQDKIDDVMVLPGVAIVLDMAQLTFLDSRAIHCFIKTCQVTRHRVVLRNATPAVRRVLELADAKAEPEAWISDGA
jgi:anti-anti-sigma factor